ncbi:uncharacterized protein LOC106401088 [Brassica napus]|uniref:uncharacterized protein LOC106401088 n=1 Tax=Brassica napus TaxID=3708 RepID=UPI00207879AE|nr:uncharacterized protein LOC106401088 [Brassica napus]
MDTYLPHMRAGGIYRLHNFFGSNNKTLYRVSEPSVTITFSSTSVLSELEDCSVCFPGDRFRFYGYEEFNAACDLKGDLYDYVGHIKLVNGQVLNDSLVVDEAEIASTRRVLLHVQTHDGPVMKMYLWDKAASDFGERFKASGGTASVVFRLNSNLDVAKRVDANVVTKTETVTIGELFSYVKQADAKVAWFECIATIDVVHGSRWYYIGCGGCHTKATKESTTLMCKKCGKSDIVGVAQYLAKISVYDNNDQAVFVLLGDSGHELSEKKASELVESYFEANEDEGSDHLVSVPQALIDTIGQTRKFIVKVSTHNLTGKTQTLTVTKVLTPEDPDIGVNLEESDGERVKRAAENIEGEEPKRAKCG